MKLFSQSNISPYETTINQILLFLYDLFQSGVGYSVMNTARSSLSTFINIDGVPVGQHPVITRFMKGFMKVIKPALPKYDFTWDVGIVITYISKINTNSLKFLSQKLAKLLVSLRGQIWAEILSVLDILSYLEKSWAIRKHTCDKNWRHSEELWTQKPYWRNKIRCISKWFDNLSTELFKTISRSNKTTQG